MAHHDAPVMNPAVEEGLVSPEAVALGVQDEGINVAPILGVIGVIMAFVVVAVIAMFQITNLEHTKVELASASYSGHPELQQLRMDAAEALTQYAVVDEAAGVYRIPVDQAMQLMLNEAQGQSGNYSNELVLGPAN